MELTFSAELVQQIDPPQSMRGKILGFEIVFRPDIVDWCKENKVKPSPPMPEVVFGTMALGPFRCHIRNVKKAILFKLRWC